MAPSASDGDLFKHSAVQENEGANRQQQAAAWEEQRVESKYARTLEQLPPDRKISPQPNDWVCDSTGVTDNLWLNLSTGHIGSGRMHWDGSGGNGVASSLVPNRHLRLCIVAACARAAGSRQIRRVSRVHSSHEAVYPMEIVPVSADAMAVLSQCCWHA